MDNNPINNQSLDKAQMTASVVLLPFVEELRPFLFSDYASKLAERKLI